MQHKRDQFIATLGKFAPVRCVEYLADCIIEARVQFKIVRGRKTKLGDFRAQSNKEKPVITVNGNLNEYSFLITSLHELAHLDTYRLHGNLVAPHGKEWKTAFAKRLLPLLDAKLLPEDLHQAVYESLHRLKATSGSDLRLSRILKSYDTQQTLHLEQLPFKALFMLQNKVFIKGELRRTRYLCTEKSSKRIYLIHALAAITPLTNDQQ